MQNSFTKDHNRQEIELPYNYSAYEHKDVIIDVDGIITEFACMKGTHLTLYL